MESEDRKKLTPKEEKFCYEYLIDLNATRAAIRAGYSEKTARTIACQNLAKLHIQEKIKKMKANLSETAGITALKVLNEHAKIAFSNISNLHNTWYEKKEFEKLPEEIKSCISEIETRIRTEYVTGPDGKSKPVKVGMIRVKLYDKQKALEAITAILGFNAAHKTELLGKIEFGKLSDEQLDQIIAELINKGKQ